jgi:hypothetical protein
VHGGRAKASDFLPEFKSEPVAPQTPEQIKRLSLQINAMFGGTVS